MRRDLSRLSETEYDVCVVGGGIYGASVARDAASRGLTVALLEKTDFGHATTFNSQKTIHGGFRYLQNADLPRLRAAVRERRAWMEMAPHLVHPVPFLVPTYRDGGKPRALLYAAFRAYDLLSPDRNPGGDPGKKIPSGRLLSRAETLGRIPDLDEPALTGGALFHDGLIHNSERLVLALLRSAYGDGAAIANYAEVTGFREEGARIAGVRAKDGLTGDTFEVRAKMTVNTAGPWVPGLLGTLRGGKPPAVRLMKVLYLVLKRPLFPCALGLLGGHGRYYFVLPWHGHSLVGIAEMPSEEGDLDRIAIREEDLERFLADLNRSRPGLSLRRDDVVFFHAGLLPADERAAARGEVRLTTRARILDGRGGTGPDGLISVVAIKFTMARRVAERIVNEIFRRRGKSPPACTTASSRVHGGGIDRFDEFLAKVVAKERRRADPATIGHLVRNYGTEYTGVLDLARADGGEERLGAASPVIRAEVIHAVREEMAVKMTDVVFRRTELGLFGHPGEEALADCAGLIAAETGWSASRVESEIGDVCTALAEGSLKTRSGRAPTAS